MNARFYINKTAFSILTFIALVCPISTFASTDSGIQWLSGQDNTDGSYSSTGDIATPLQATAETLRTFNTLNSDQPGITGARQYVRAETFQNTEYLSRQIVTGIEAGEDVTSFIAQLVTHQNLDNGFGDLAGYDSTVLETAFALEALALSGQSTSQAAGFAISNLLSKQDPDGGWSYNSPDSSPFITAITLTALWQYRSIYNLNAALDSAGNYLLNQRNTNHLWDETFISSLALIALINSLADLSELADSLSALRNTQLSDGSWDSDVYTTALALRALALAEKPPSNTGLATMLGNVIDGQTGLPLSGVNVDLTGPSPQSLETDSSGLFEFHDLIPGDYSLQLTKIDYAPLTASTVANAGQTINFGSLQLLQAGSATTATIRGTITDEGSGLPLEGASITVTGVSTPVQTDPAGNYQITNVPPGNVIIKASLAGYSAATGTADLTAGNLFVFSHALTPVTAPSTELRGTVTDAVTGLPIEGATITITGATSASTTTDTAGNYQIAGLDPGDTAIEVAATGYDSVLTTAIVFENNILIFSPMLYLEDSTPPGSNTAGVTGVVVDSTTNQPLAGVNITATFGTDTINVTTDSDGLFTIKEIEELTGTLQFTLADYVSTTLGVTLVPLTISDIGQVRLRPEAAIELLPDLLVRTVDASTASNDPDTLEFTGDLSIEIANEGTSIATSGIEALAFYDNDQNNTYDAGVDTFLGTATTTAELDVGANEVVLLAVNGFLPYRDAPVKVWVDSLRSVIESNEKNNVNTSSSLCQVQPDIGAFEPVLKWEWTGSPILSEHDQVMSTPVVAPLEDNNDDGQINALDIPSVVFHTYRGTNFRSDGVLRAISGIDGHELWTIDEVEYRTNGEGSVAVADIDNDGLIEIIAPKNGGGIIVFENTGEFKWLSNTPANVFWGGASISDLDSDGIPEIIVGNTVLNADGSLHWQGSGFTGTVYSVTGPLSIVGDVNLDGDPEVIAGASVYSSIGDVLWQNTIVGDGFTALGNFNTDANPEIVVVSSSRVSLLDYQGNIIWGPISIPGGGRGGPPTVADVDGDGMPEIGVAGGSMYTVFETDGSVKWSSPTRDQSSNMTGSSVFDFDGDGSAEIVYADELFLRVYQGNDGAIIFETANSSGTTYELPVIVDVDNDDHSDIVLCANQLLQKIGRAPGPGYTGIRVYQDINNSWLNTRKIWNQHSYHINNINDDGTIPVEEESSWLSHNTYRLNTFMDRDPLSSSDLTAARLQVNQQGGGGLSLTALIGNAGLVSSPADVDVDFYEGDPETGGTLIGTVQLPSLTADSYQTVTLPDVTSLVGGQAIFVVVDVNSNVTECNETNNTAQAPAPDLFPDLIVNLIDTSSASFDEQTLVISGDVSAEIQNQGTATSVTEYEVLAFLDTNENDVYDVGTDTLLGQTVISNPLAAGSSETIQISVNSELSFRDIPISVWIDSTTIITESFEDNNVNTSASVCQVAPEIGTSDPVLKWEWHNSSVRTGTNSVYGPVSVGQLTDDNNDGFINEDDDVDFVFMSVSSGQVLNVISGKDGSEIWSLAGDFFAYGSVALGDIDADGIVEIVVVNAKRTALMAYEHTGDLKWSVPHGPTFSSSISHDGVAIADLDGDGTPEIVAGRHAYNNEGDLLWQGNGNHGGETGYGVISIVADVDLDGKSEVIAGRTLYDSEGNTLWNAATINNGFNAVGNFDDDDYAEIVQVVGGRVYLLEHTGDVIWGPVSIPGGGFGGPPTIADVDGDGLPEIGVAGASRYLMLEHDGTTKWTNVTVDASSNRTGSSVFDFEGDGKAEVAYADEQNLFIYDGVTGKVLVQIPNRSGTTLEYPVIADIDKDGNAELVLGVSAGTGSSRGVRAYESVNDDWIATRSIWNQHSYHITNINDDGSIPANEQPSWLTHNSYRLNTFTDRSPRAAADLSASRLQVIDSGAGQPLSLQVRIGNASLAATPNGVSVSFYDGDPESGGTMIGTTSMAALVPYEFQDVQLDGVTLPSGTTDIFAFVDANNQLSECNEANNITHATVPTSILGQISVATDALIYAPNSNVELQSLTTNAGALTGEFKLKLTVEDLQGVVITSFTNIATGTLLGGATFTHNENWNTANFIADTYQLRGVLTSLDDTVIDESINSFEVRHDESGAVPAVTLRTTTDKATYHTTDTVLIDGLVRNLTLSTHVLDASLHVVITNPSAQQLFVTDIVLGDLNPNGLRQIGSVYNLVGATEGQYTVTGEVRNSMDNVLAQDTAQFIVEEDISLSLIGSVIAQSSQLKSGETQICTDTVTNQGTLSVSDLELRQLLVNVNTEAEDFNKRQIVNLIAGASQQLIRSLDTTGLEAGQYGCVLQAKKDNEWQTLAFDNFELLEPPIHIETELTLGDKGRVLVLMDPEQATCTATESVTFTVEFPESVTDHTQVYAKVYDQHGHLIDYEEATPDGHDQHFGHGYHKKDNDIDVDIVELNIDQITFAVDASKTRDQIFTEAYTFKVIYKDKGHGGHHHKNHHQSYLELSSDLVELPCGEPLEVPSDQGDLEIIETDTIELLEKEMQHKEHNGHHHKYHFDYHHSKGHGYDKGYGKGSGERHDRHHNDRHVSENAEIPLLSEQKAYLGSLLLETNTSYTIVHNKHDFIDAFHTGGYNQYLLLAERIKLSNDITKELREAVNRGDGIIFASGSSPKQLPLYDALGILPEGGLHGWHYGWHLPKKHWGHDHRYSGYSKTNGTFFYADGVELFDSLLGLGTFLNFNLNDTRDNRLLMIEPDTATNVGEYLGVLSSEKCHGHTGTGKKQCRDKDYPAVTTNNYGNGRAVYIGFDWLAEATRAGQTGATNDNETLLINSLSYTQPLVINTRAGGTVPILLSLNNLGITAQGQVIVTLPVGSRIVDPNEANEADVISEDHLRYPFTLEEAAVDSLIFWAIPAYDVGLAEIEALVQVGETPDFMDLETITLTIDETQAASLLDIIDEISLLEPQDHHLWKAQHWLNKAMQAIAEERLHTAMKDLLKAVDALRRSEYIEAPKLREQLDWGIWQLAQEL
ncbi:MAG: hypothetical protein GY727_16570 [Gammaproteobacteria bacterium]|nr:hypothetical protein [Gammaproteobacteria bacterium]